MPKQTSLERFSTIADFELVAGGQSYDVVQVAPEIHYP